MYMYGFKERQREILTQNAIDLLTMLIVKYDATINVKSKNILVLGRAIGLDFESFKTLSFIEDCMEEDIKNLCDNFDKEDVDSLRKYVDAECVDFWTTFKTKSYLENEEGIDSEYRVVIGDEYKDAFGHTQYNYYQVMIVNKYANDSATLIFFDNELKYVKEQHTQCKRLDDALALLRNTNSIATGLSMNVYRDSTIGDCTCNGISSKCNRFEVVGEKIKDGLEIRSIKDMLSIDYVKLGNYPPYYFAKQVYKNKGHFSMGGNFIYTPDSRNGYGYPLPIHDRQENYN